MRNRIVYLIAGVLAILFAAGIAFAQAPDVDARNITCSPIPTGERQSTEVANLTYELWRTDGPTDVPVEVDPEGNPVPRQHYINRDAVEQYVALGMTPAEALENACQDIYEMVATMTEGELAAADAKAAATPEDDLLVGVGVLTRSADPVDPEIVESRDAARALLERFRVARSADPPDCEEMAAVVAEASELTLEDADAKILARGQQIYARACGGAL